MKQAIELGDALFKGVDNVSVQAKISDKIIQLLSESSLELSSREIVSLLGSLVGHKIAQERLNHILNLKFDFISMDVLDVVEILDIVLSISYDIYLQWISKIYNINGSQSLIDRFINKTSYALPLQYLDTKDNTTIDAYIDKSKLVDSKDSIVEIQQSYCRSIFTLIPKASQVRCRVVDTTETVLRPENCLSLKRTEPTNATQQISRQVAKAIWVKLGANSWSQYLENETKLLEKLYELSSTYSNQALVNSINDHVKRELRLVIDHIEKLVPPVDGFIRANRPFNELAPVHGLTGILGQKVPDYVRNLPNSSQDFISEIEEVRENLAEIRKEP